MKKLLSLIAVIVVIGGIWYVFHRSTTPQKGSTIINSNPVTTDHPDASNATFSIDDSNITLSNGTATTDISGTAVTQETDLTDTAGYGDLNADGKEDAAVMLVQSGSGSGTFFSIAAYVSGPISYKGTNAVFVGDRIQPKSISIKGTTITVTYLDRTPDEPLTDEPTVSTTKTYTYSSIDNSIEEQ